MSNQLSIIVCGVGWYLEAEAAPANNNDVNVNSPRHPI